MIKRLVFVTGFGVGFVVGSASGRKSYETLKQNALRTWNDPKVQEKIAEGTDRVRAEVPVVGGKLADGAKRAADTVGAKVSSTAGNKTEGAPTAETSTDGSSSDYQDLATATPVTPDSPQEAAEPLPTPGEDRA